MPSGIYKRTEIHKKKISDSIKGMFAGSKHPNWKGGITPLRKKLYFSEEYKLWRKSVFIRDDFTCIWCGQIGGRLNADHIKPWASYPELRFAIDNGRTLCELCHRKTHTYGVWDSSKILIKKPRKATSGSFKKGHKGYKAWLGKTLSIEHRKKLSESHKKTDRVKT